MLTRHLATVLFGIALVMNPRPCRAEATGRRVVPPPGGQGSCGEPLRGRLAQPLSVPAGRNPARPLHRLRATDLDPCWSHGRESAWHPQRPAHGRRRPSASAPRVCGPASNHDHERRHRSQGHGRHDGPCPSRPFWLGMDSLSKALCRRPTQRLRPPTTSRLAERRATRVGR